MSKHLNLNKVKVISNYSNKGNLVCSVKSTSDDKILCVCSVCEKPKFVNAQSLYRSIEFSWHKSYRCGLCVNVGREYTEAHKNNIKNSLMGKPLSEVRKKNIGYSVAASYKNNKGWNKKFEYRDVLFRSSYELRLAKFLDKNSIDWEYESYVFYLENIKKHYCPDFFIPKLNLFIEVKGFWRDDAKLKYDTLKTLIGNRLMLVNETELVRIENEQRL